MWKGREGHRSVQKDRLNRGTVVILGSVDITRNSDVKMKLHGGL